ncbi:hypothetical protein H6G54_21200 [Anabaena cylindrica FACHB-243]|uniref:Uncharacterized protein n=1 Tax=Anabaena cylindrica (strain ATCC 27899 / PCC 7122) TaxID=272123 RepID=K9ZS18_ANACC|nr:MULTISPECIES: hypothetical protein [Anabaena]AFZ61317.1 hypothetical protein Anacy_6040 [Anabaena cylindrica PCC 7122]MBD2420174.1 hypothetical protein [Anabaena cylindrica FACHB-243]MBY5282199.1 hypothetical protein [Anabaena sp. CCAP 1446/1C]MBY5309444.1 hypothetical protein [Anabaena sp. CCAP 1446/1C]MCM2409259.1 hypothetical protein [Anabaena sp. CCAP 1446/1C]
MGTSGRGGKREGGGRPSNWQYQPTCTIRVPKIFAEILLKTAQELDKGLNEIIIVDPKKMSVSPQVKKEVLSLSQLRIYTREGHKTLRLEELISVLQQCLKQKD